MKSINVPLKSVKISVATEPTNALLESRDYGTGCITKIIDSFFGAEIHWVRDMLTPSTVVNGSFPVTHLAQASEIYATGKTMLCGTRIIGGRTPAAVAIWVSISAKSDSRRPEYIFRRAPLCEGQASDLRRRHRREPRLSQIHVGRKFAFCRLDNKPTGRGRSDVSRADGGRRIYDFNGQTLRLMYVEPFVPLEILIFCRDQPCL